MTTCPSTQPQASGTRQASSRSSRLPPRPPPGSGRQTRTAQKAAQPLPITQEQPHQAVHPSLLVHPPSPTVEQLSLSQPGSSDQAVQVVIPPTHPVQSFPFSNIPTISQLRDFPNLSFPLQPAQPSVIVTLPQSAPSSPIPTYSSSPDPNIQAGNPFTPSRSPEISVISPNPSFLPVPPPVPPRVSTPASSPGEGSWDNFLDDPSYQGFDQQFWNTRESRQIQLVSTDISELENLSELNGSEFSLDLFERGQLNSTQSSQLDSPATQQVTVTAITMSERTTAEANLRSLDIKVMDMCEMLDPALIDQHYALSVHSELEKIIEALDKYKAAVRQFLSDFDSDLVETETAAWNADVVVVFELVLVSLLHHSGTCRDSCSSLTWTHPHLCLREPSRP